MWPWWTNDLDFAHLQTKTVPKNLIWSNSPSGCWVPLSSKSQEPLSCPRACPLRLYEQMTKTLNIYRPRWFQRTWFGKNRPCGYWVTASAKFELDEWTDGRRDGEHSIVPLFFFRKGRGTKICYVMTKCFWPYRSTPILADNGFLPSTESCGTNLRPISKEVLVISTRKMSLRNTLVKYFKHLPGAIKFKKPMYLNHCSLVTPYGDSDLGQHWLR